MDLSSTVSLYYRGPNEDYSDIKRQTLALMLGRDEQELVFNVAATSGPIAAMRIQLLLDKGPSVNYLKIYGLTITQSSETTAEEELLINARNAGELKQQTVVNGLSPHNRALGELYIVDTAEPYIEVLFPTPVDDTRTHLKVRLVLEALFGDEYILARDLFLTRQEQLEQEIRSSMQRIRTLEQENEEFTQYQGSSAWTIFLWLHKCQGQFTRVKRAGLFRSFLKTLRPSWWVRRNSTEYEKWRTEKGYRNRDNNRA